MPSSNKIAIRSREERVERRDGSDKRWRGRRVVGKILEVSTCYVEKCTLCSRAESLEAWRTPSSQKTDNV